MEDNCFTMLCAKAFKFNWVPTVYFAFVSFALGDRSKKKTWFMSRSILLLFSSRSFMVSSLTFRPLIHFEFIFVYGVRKCSNFTTWGHPLYVSCKALLFPFLGFHSLTPSSPSFFLILNNWAASTIFYFLKSSQLIKTWGLGRVDSGSAWAGFTLGGMEPRGRGDWSGPQQSCVLSSLSYHTALHLLSGFTEKMFLKS